MAYVQKKYSTGASPVDSSYVNYNQSDEYDWLKSVDTALGGNTGLTKASLVDPISTTKRIVPEKVNEIEPFWQKGMSLSEKIEQAPETRQERGLAPIQPIDFGIKPTKKGFATTAMETLGFTAAQRPEDYTLGEEIGDSSAYIGGKFVQGTLNVFAGLSSLQSKMSPTYKHLNNVIASTIAKREAETGISFDKLAKTDFERTFVSYAKEGQDFGAGLARLGYGEMGEKIDPLEVKISQVAKLLGMVAESAPQTALMAIPVAGMGLYAGTSLANNMDEFIKGERPWYEEYGYAFGSTVIDVGSEMIFGLFAKSASLFKGAAARQAARMAKDQVTPTAGKLIASVFLSGLEEGAEEVIAQPFQQFLDWRYFNPDVSIQDGFLNWQTAKDMGQAGLVGFVSGFMFAGGQVIPAITNPQRQATAKYEKDVIKKADRAIELYDQIVDYPIDAENPMKKDPKFEALVKEYSDLLDEMMAETVYGTMEKPDVPTIIKADGTVEPMPMPNATETGASQPTNVAQPATGDSTTTQTLQSYVQSKYESKSQQQKATESLLKPIDYKVPSASEAGSFESRTTLAYDFAVEQASNPSATAEVFQSKTKSGTRNRYEINIQQGDNSVRKVVPKVVYDLFVETQKNLQQQSATTDAETTQKIKIESTVDTMKLGEYDVQVEKFSTNNGVLEVIKDSPYAPENYNSVYNFLVDESARGKGNGTALIKEAIKKYGEKLSAQTSNENSTRLFYNLGFRPRRNINATLSESIDMFRENESLALIYNPEIAKLSQQPTLVSESQAQNEAGRQGFVPKSFRPQRQESTEQNRPDWKKPISEDVEKRINLASKPNIDASFMDTLHEKREIIRRNITYGATGIAPQYAELRKELRAANASSIANKGEAENILAKIYNRVGDDPAKKDLLVYSIIFLDLAEDVRNGLYKETMSDLFGMKSPQNVLEIEKSIKLELNKPENAIVKETLNVRKQLMDEIRNELIAEAAKSGIDLSRINSKENYHYHKILEYSEEFNAALREKGVHSKKALAYLERTGSGKDYITDPIMSDFLVLNSFLNDTARLRVYNAVSKYDISGNLPTDEYGNKKIKPGYSELDPSMLGISNAIKYDKKKALAAERARLEELGIPLDTKRAKDALSKIAKQYEGKLLIVPSEMVHAIVRNLTPKETGGGKLTKRLVNVWKYTKIRMPNAVVKYNIRNMFGDLDAVIAGHPSSLFKVKQATKELYDYFYNGGVLTDELKHYVRRNGMTTGQTVQSLKTMEKSKLIKFYPKSQEPADVAKRGARKIWNILTANTATDFREQILRYAAYLSYVDQLGKSKSGLPRDYAASNPIEIQNLSDIRDRAYRLADDLVGAYDDVSLVGQWAADHLMPFYRFKEVNIKRYYRLIKNIFNKDGISAEGFAKEAVGKFRRGVRVGAVMIVRAAKLLMGLASFYGGIQMFNAIFAGDEEDELPEYVKNSPHLTIPRFVSGSEKIYYLDRLGSLAELFNTFGFDYGLGRDLHDIATGRMSWKEKAKEIALSPVYEAVNSSMPLAKIVLELIGGKEYFPDPTNPRQIRDKWEYIFKQVGFDDEYKAIVGKPQNKGSYPLEKVGVLANSVLPGDAALSDVYSMVEDYYSYIGESGTYTNYMNPNTDKFKRSQAAYYYKMSLKLEDWQAAEKYLAEYVGFGGTKKTLNATMRYLNPLSSLSKAKQSDFLQWITPEEKERLDKAMSWYEELTKLSAKPESAVGLR